MRLFKVGTISHIEHCLIDTMPLKVLIGVEVPVEGVNFYYLRLGRADGNGKNSS